MVRVAFGSDTCTDEWTVTQVVSHPPGFSLSSFRCVRGWQVARNNQLSMEGSPVRLPVGPQPNAYQNLPNLGPFGRRCLHPGTSGLRVP